MTAEVEVRVAPCRLERYADQTFMNLMTITKRRALEDPAVRTNVLAGVRAGLSNHPQYFGLSRMLLEALGEQLQAPPMFLYADGSFEVVAPAIGPEKALTLQWEDLQVRVVAEAGTSDLNAGPVVWSANASATATARA
jgi:hypothetical protein